jgi:hypothetical protein
MKTKNLIVAASIALPAAAFSAGLYGDIPDANHAWAVHDENRPKPSRVTVGENGVPSDAIVLFDGTKESFERNWCDGKGGPSKWIVEDGAFSCGEGFKFGECRTREEFGDCQLHIEYRHPADTKSIGGNAQMRGNSGVFLMGPKYGYEVQVLESYFTCRELEGRPEFVQNYADGQAGSIYAENPPLVNPQRRPGEWQVYDIVFHQPVWKGDQLTHPGSITVFFNGVLVQDHWEMEGQTTHCRRRPLAPHPAKGPLSLQDHGCSVSFRNVWIRPIASRWDNLTHSNMSADPEKVMAERRATAAKLYAKIADPKSATAETVKALGEVVSYADEGVYAADFRNALEAYRAKPGDANEVKSVNRALDVLVRGKVIPESAKIAECAK